ncbi:MAG: FlxA-like family protein [Roseburia sp.]|nr:FlxA-like family protein [Roseburia sp.]
MAVSSIQSMSIKADQLRVTPTTDMYTKNIQQQIMDNQKKMQDISSDHKMSVEEKMKKRQEIQQEISDLNNQLRQHLAEKQKEQQQEQKKAETQAASAQSTSSQETGIGIPGIGMSAMISAGTSLKQAQSHDSVKVKLEGRAGVLRAEIKQDAPRGNVEAKERELAEIEKKVSDVSSAQMSSLKGANQAMKEAAKVEVSDEKTGKTDQNKTGKEVWLISNGQKKGVGISGTGQTAKDSDTADTVIKKKAVSYVSVDIRG